MKKNLTIISLFVFLFLNMIAANAHYEEIPKKPTHQQVRTMDKILDERLNLTSEQKAIIKKNRPKNKKEMEDIVKKMQKLHDEINEVYMSGLPNYQVYLLTAPKKAQLAVLNQNAKNLKESHRKAFEAILTNEQKAEFEKIKAEYTLKKPR